MIYFKTFEILTLNIAHIQSYIFIIIIKPFIIHNNNNSINIIILIEKVIKMEIQCIMNISENLDL